MTFLRKNKLLIAILSVVILVFGITFTTHASNPWITIDDIVADEEENHITVTWSTKDTLWDIGWITSFFISATTTHGGHKADEKALHKDLAGNLFYIWSTWSSESGGQCHANLTDIALYSTNTQYQTTFSSINIGGSQMESITDYLAGGHTEVYARGYPSGSSCALIDEPFIDTELYTIGDYQPPDEISITYPTSTAPYDFSQWEVNFATATSTTATSTDFYTIQVYTGTTSSIITSLSGGTSYTFNVGDLSVNNTRFFNQNTTYYSEAELRYFKDIHQDFGDLVATSDMNTFTTTGVSEQESEESFYVIPTSTSTSAEWTFTCDPESGLFENSLCNLARFLFVPTTASIERFGNLQDTIKDKPPFGYWYEIKGEIQSITTTTAAFTLTGVSVLAENDTFKTIKTTISVILWFLFAFWILHRIRLFDFQK